MTATERNARTRILETAWLLVGERGLLQVTVADIAAASGVSRQLVYHHFDGRSGLLLAMARHHDGVTGFRKRVVASRELAPVDGLETLLRLWLEYVPLILPVARALEAAAATGDEGGVAWRDRMDDIREAFRLAAERIAVDGRLAEPWTPDTAADWMTARTHVALWQQLVVERDWAPADYAERTIASIMAELVTPARDE
jgi:AcrR family transcriptional regulator